MQRRNLDFGVALTRDEWMMLGERAAALGADAGFVWAADQPETIRLFVTDEHPPAGFDRYVEPERRYGRPAREIARFLWNEGRPMAELHPPTAPEEPAITDEEEQAMQAQLENWVRNRWNALMRESGLHYVGGHAPVERPRKR